MSGSEGATEAQASIPSQLAYLVPSFDPAKDDLQLYQQKVQLVLEVWPAGKISELVTRLILNCTGSAFSILQLHFSELKNNDPKSVKRLIELLGGHWGKTGLEKRFADAERALFQCNQQSDESHDSYLARADVLWTKLRTQELKLEDLQAYITLRGAQLSSEDKKRIILDSDNSLEGKLTILRVQESVRMLGTSFFHEMTGQGRKTSKAKVYDQHAMFTEDIENDIENEDQVNLAGHEEWFEEEFLDQLVQEGDHDAVFVTDFESAASELLQSDDDLASAYSTYVEARKKLSEKFRSRGFWPIGKGKSKFTKGRGKGKSMWGSRKSLQQRIMETNCRLCGRKGHWKSECPTRHQAGGSGASSAAVTLSVGSSGLPQDQSMPQEFLDLPEVPVPAAQDHGFTESCFVQTVFFNENTGTPSIRNPLHNMRDNRWERIRTYIKGNKGGNSNVMSLVSRIEAKLQRQRHEPSAATTKQATPFWRSRSERAQRSVMHATRTCSTEASDSQKTAASLPNHVDTIPVADVLFATHDTWGIIDTGATKTVMGSKFVPEFLKSLKPHIRKQVQRCSCDVVFRFGNQGTLSSTHAMVVPVGGLHLKIAIVPGSTPFLVSNTLIRALGAVVDTQRNRLTLPKYQCEIPLELAEKGLYLIDTNDLFDVTTAQNHPNAIAETFAQDSDPAAETVQPTGPQEEHRDTHEVSKITNQSDEKGQRSQVFNPEVTNPTCRNHITMPASPNMPPANSRPTQVSRISSETSDIRQCNEPRLDSTSPEGSDRDGEARSRADRSPDVGRSSERACDVWQTPSREIPRGGVAKQSRTGQSGFCHTTAPARHWLTAV